MVAQADRQRADNSMVVLVGRLAARSQADDKLVADNWEDNLGSGYWDRILAEVAEEVAAER